MQKNFTPTQLMFKAWCENVFDSTSKLCEPKKNPFSVLQDHHPST